MGEGGVNVSVTQSPLLDITPLTAHCSSKRGKSFELQFPKDFFAAPLLHRFSPYQQVTLLLLNNVPLLGNANQLWTHNLCNFSCEQITSIPNINLPLFAVQFLQGSFPSVQITTSPLHHNTPFASPILFLGIFGRDCSPLELTVILQFWTGGLLKSPPIAAHSYVAIFDQCGAGGVNPQIFSHCNTLHSTSASQIWPRG